MTIMYPSNSSGAFKRSETVQLGIKGTSTVISPALNYVKKHRVAAAQSITISGLVQQGDRCAVNLYRLLGSLKFAGSLSF